jgi:hypothetical protein
MLRAHRILWLWALVLGCAASLGCTGSLDSGARTGAPFDPAACELGPRATPEVSRLTREEYDRTVEALTGRPSTFGRSLPADDAHDGLERGGPVAPLIADQLIVAAETLAEDVDLSRIVPCDPAVTGADACARTTAIAFARRAYRRPATEAEIEALLVLYREGSTDPSVPVGFEDGVRWMVAGALSAPQFLYHEWGELSGEHAPTDPLHGYAIASRLSYFLWGTMPDDALLDAAERGDLSTREGVASEARRMLDDDRAREGVRSFFRQWLHIDRVHGLSKDGTLFPGFDGDAARDLEGSLHAFTDHAFWEGGYHELEDSPNVWLNGRLSMLYGADGGPAGDALEPFVLDPGERSGLLAQPALLATLATPDQGHPIRRGVFVRETLLCQDLRPPPPDVATPIPALDSAPTTRERFEAHVSSTSCRGCHQLIDGLGFALERFDAIGAARETENGVAIDDSGTICSFPNCDSRVEVDGAVGLAETLSETGLMRDCITREWMRYAVHAPVAAVDRCELARISDALRTTDDLGELLVAIASSELMGNAPAALDGGTSEGGE